MSFPFGKTVPVISAKVGEVMRVHLVNIGDQIHSFQAHSVSHISIGTLDGGRWAAANLLPLLPGAADTCSSPSQTPVCGYTTATSSTTLIGIFNITNE